MFSLSYLNCCTLLGPDFFKPINQRLRVTAMNRDKINKLPPFDQSQLEAIAKVLADTSSGLTGSEIAHLLPSSHIIDCDPTNTKWKRLYNAFAEFQNQYQIANNIIRFINLAMAPARYTNTPQSFLERQEKLNQVLSFSGFKLHEDGKIHHTPKACTLTDAIERAQRFKSQLERRNVHSDVLKFAEAEIIAANYFHAILEAMKSVTAKIREKTGYYADGADLVNSVFMGQSPILVINDFKTPTQQSEQKGFANLLIGLYGTFRNPTAHEAKIEWEMSEQDALDILTTISLIHRKLDKARQI